MTLKDPYQIIKHQHLTEKSKMLQELQTADSNPSLRRCESPKYVFIVDSKATKRDIAAAMQAIYPEIQVVAVNTINVKAKATRRRGRRGWKSAFKKAIVTLEKRNSLEEL